MLLTWIIRSLRTDPSRSRFVVSGSEGHRQTISVPVLCAAPTWSGHPDRGSRPPPTTAHERLAKAGLTQMRLEPSCSEGRVRGDCDLRGNQGSSGPALLSRARVNALSALWTPASELRCRGCASMAQVCGTSHHAALRYRIIET